MKRIHTLALLAAVNLGLLGAASAQSSNIGSNNARIASAVFYPSQGVLLRQVDSDDHRRCDGDHDRDDRGCYYRDRDGRYRYYGNGYYGYGYYGNSYEAPYYYSPYAVNGWYDRDGRWHEYKRPHHKKHHHDDDDDWR